MTTTKPTSCVITQNGRFATFITNADGSVTIAWRGVGSGETTMPRDEAIVVYRSLMRSGFVGSTAEAAAAAPLLQEAPVVARDTADAPFMLGDTVTGVYFGETYTGILSGFDGSGYVYVSFPAPFSQPVVQGFQRDGIALHPSSSERGTMRLVSRPVVAPDVKLAPAAVLGGAYLAA